MRQQQPSIQRDDDIDHILPLAEVDSFQSGSTGIHSGQSTTADGAVTMNYFLARIQLAVIEGGVYDYLYSTRSQKRTPDDRAKALDSVACALEQWKASVPPEFSAATASQTVPLHLLPFISFLHSTSFMCAALINQAHAWNAKWSILPHLAPKAKVFDVSSGIAHIGPLPGVWAYAATKAANTKLFQYLQAENPELHVISIQPGVILTEINANTYFENQDDTNLPGHFQVWLASPEAEFLKGKFVWANWDLTRDRPLPNAQRPTLALASPSQIRLS
ncbi:hypothetical protein LTR70_007605 [Exophiala xenobiotica]|uniref:NAD(P)-binding protein n=1 Tax=Lithohypha guttulata TaxID=1690604 RepID=A0ABR0KJJ5_9EURO|nr:hypothetical protein LTR24_002274 [Lithohypha guttulata]KAK5313496.1 hypothetical protein LTR70_007605 [Exophiala xenobiotica]